MISTHSETITGALADLIENYHDSYHSVIGMSPNEVSEYNATQVFRNIIKKATLKRQCRLNVCDKVRESEKVRTLYTGL